MREDFLPSMLFWIDTDAYTDRDRAMFVSGYEFCQILSLLDCPDAASKTIHAENESRVRMAAAKKGREISLEASGSAGWTFLEIASASDR